jgi:hypothetical protein
MELSAKERGEVSQLYLAMSVSYAHSYATETISRDDMKRIEILARQAYQDIDKAQKGGRAKVPKA